MDLESVLSLINFDPMMTGVDAGIALSINGLADRLKAYLESAEWDVKIRPAIQRAYFLLPFICAFFAMAFYCGFCGWSKIGIEAIRYGMYATVTYHGIRKVALGH